MNNSTPAEPSGRKLSVLWVIPVVLDAELHSNARLQIIQQFADAGHRTALVALRSKEKPATESLGILAVPLRYVPMIQPIMFAIVQVFLLPLYILYWRPDFIIFTQPDISILGSIPAILVSRLRKVKCVLDIRSTPVETGIKGHLQSLWFSVSVLVAKSLLDGITIITNHMKNEVCRKFWIDPAWVGVWTSGVSTNLYNPKRYAGQEEELKNKLGLTGKFVVFYHGAFGVNRGITELVEAVGTLKSNHPDIVALLLGKGPSSPQLKALVEKQSLQDNVKIHEPVEYSEVPRFIASCDVCASPLPDHPFWRFQCPLKLLEYLAMEKVVILSDIPAHRAVVDDARCGIYISSVEPTEIARAIKYAYDNAGKLKEWGMTGRRIIEKKYAWQNVASDLKNYLLSLPNRR